MVNLVTIDAVSQASTVEWVDEAYSRRLWGQLLRRADNTPSTSLGYFSTVRKHAAYVWRDNSKGHEWYMNIFIPAANRALDLVAIKYNRNGRLKRSVRLLRISEHAGQRLFERLRTNSVDDVLDTLCLAVLTFIQHNALKPTEYQGVDKKVVMTHGTLHVVADAGLWVAKTFIPAKRD